MMLRPPHWPSEAESRLARERAADTALWNADPEFARELGIVPTICRGCDGSGGSCAGCRGTGVFAPTGSTGPK
jgi:hypothetical protein